MVAFILILHFRLQVLHLALNPFDALLLLFVDVAHHAVVYPLAGSLNELLVASLLKQLLAIANFPKGLLLQFVHVLLDRAVALLHLTLEVLDPFE